MTSPANNTFEEEKKDDGEHKDHPAPASMKEQETDGKPATVQAQASSRIAATEDKLKDANETSPLDDKKLGKGNKWISSTGRFLSAFLRTLVIDLPPLALFVALVATMFLRHMNDRYFAKQIELMMFQGDSRDFEEITYYHRYCNMDDDVTATTVEELLVPFNATAEDCVAHQMTHGASVYRNLLTTETMHVLREFIVEENKKQEGFHVIENEFRYSWGIDVNMHPALKKYWKELASNEVFVRGIQAIVGPDPAIIEFTAITSAYGAVDQFEHQDVVAPGSGIKSAHSYFPSYSLFIPLQDTSYDMGATHVCPGSHLCAEGAPDNCKEKGYNIPMSGDIDMWPKGWGALVNQQTTHKGMGHTKEGGLDRVVIIATFAPRPQTFRGLETRLIGQGGSYSIDPWSWGHTFSDFVFAEKRMWEPLKSMRALGLVKGSGWNLMLTASMRIANNDNGYRGEHLDDFLDAGGFWFLPRKWQVGLDDAIEDDAEMEDLPGIDNEFYKFLLGTLERTEKGLKNWYATSLSLCLLTLMLVDLSRCLQRRRISFPFSLGRGVVRLLLLHGLVVVTTFWGLRIIDESNWAKDIAAGRSYRLPAIEFKLDDVRNRDATIAVLPTAKDILVAPHYALDHLAGYGRVLDYNHPGNVAWNAVVNEHASGYFALSDELRKQFCESLVAYFRQDARFLEQGEEREWIQVADEVGLLCICRRAFFAASAQRNHALVRQIDSLKSATKVGRFARTAMQERIIARYLDALESHLIPTKPLTSPAKKNKIPWIIPKSILATAISANARNPHAHRHTIPTSHEPREPFPLAWLQELDSVEAMYNCEGEYYYKGTVLSIAASHGTFDVGFDDGDINEGLDSSCLRPVQPYSMGDEVEVKQWEDGEMDWYPGYIIKIMEKIGKGRDGKELDLVFDIELDEDGTILKGVKAGQLRRMDIQSPISVGDQVYGNFEDAGKWFRGTIMRLNPDGTFFIQYADGDFEYSVPRSRIR